MKLSRYTKNLIYTLILATSWIGNAHAEIITLKNDSFSNTIQPQDINQSKALLNDFKKYPSRNISAPIIKGNASSLSKKSSQDAAVLAASVIAPTVSGCATINIGYVYNSTTAPAGSYTCYQFIINGKQKIDTQVVLPVGINGSVYLYYVDPATGQLTTVLDSDQSPNNPLLVQSVNQDVRLVFVIQPSNGTGGKTFQLGSFSRPNFDSYEPNDKPFKPKTISMNQTVNANIDVAGIDRDYYFFPLVTGQTSAGITVNFNSNQSSSFYIAQRNSQGIYSLWSNEITIPFTKSGVPNFYNGFPASTSSITYGVLLKIAGINNISPNAQTYSARIGDDNTVISGYTQNNTENITRWNPTHGTSGLTAANYITLTANVTGSNGNPVQGELVRFNVYTDRLNQESTYVYKTALTDVTGKATATINFPTCILPYTYTDTYTIPTTPIQTWRGESQIGQWNIELPQSNSAGITTSTTIYFVRMCKETFLR